MHDTDVIGFGSLSWALMKSYLPMEMTQCMEEELDCLQPPRLATRNVNEGVSLLLTAIPHTDTVSGPGFTIKLDGATYSFGKAVCAPPELYLGTDYVS